MDWTGAFMAEFIEIIKAYGPGGGLIGVTTFFIFMVYTGRLVPRATVNAILQRTDAEVVTWKTTAEKTAAARDEERAQMGELMEQMKVTNQLLKSLPINQPTQAGGG